MRPVVTVAEDDRGAPAPRPGLGDARADGQAVLREPTPVELIWMEELRIHLRAPDVDITSIADLCRLFDTYCEAWHQRPDGERWNPDYVITALGVALGDVLVQRGSTPCGGTRWMVTRGHDSTTVAVRNDTLRRTIFPVDAVARRWISAETGWIAAFVEAIGAPGHQSLSR